MPRGAGRRRSGPEKLRDLLTFLLTEPLQPAPLERPGAPPPRAPGGGRGGAGRRARRRRKRAGRKLHVVLVAGPKDHGPGEHDYPAVADGAGSNLLGAGGRRHASSTADGWPTPSSGETADVVVFYSANPALVGGAGERTSTPS